MKKTLCLLLIYFSVSALNAQINVDSLENVLQTQSLTNAEKLVIYNQLALTYSYYDYKNSLKYVEMGLPLAIKEKDEQKAANFNHIIGLNHYTKPAYDSAIVYYNKALKIAIEIEDKKHEIGLYGSIGSSYAQLGELNTSVEYFFKALSMNEELGDKVAMILTMGNLSSIYRRLHNYDRAIYYLEQIKDMSEEMNYLPGKCRAYFDLGGIYKDTKEYEKALDYQLKVIEISRSINLRQYEIAAMITVAQIYFEGYNDSEKAEKYASESSELAKEFGDPHLQRGILIVLSDIYKRQGHFDKSRKAALEAWEIDSKELDSNRALLANLVYSNVQLGNIKEATTFLELYENIIIEFNKKSLHDSLTDQEIKYETEKKELLIASLEKEKQYYIWLGVLGVFILILGSGIFIYRSRLNKQKIKQLEQEKQLVATQALLDGETAERSRLARDLHDGLGGLLSVLNLNLNEIESPAMTEEQKGYFIKASEILDESNKELRRIAHHMMPASLMKVGLKTSLADFSQAIPGVSFQYQGKDIRLDERLEVTIYRCAYELINNAVKYADATKIDVQLLVEDHFISLSVLDNGKGFNPDKVTEGSGLANLKTRIATFNGKLHIDSSVDKGTEVTIEIELS